MGLASKNGGRRHSGGFLVSSDRRPFFTPLVVTEAGGEAFWFLRVDPRVLMAAGFN